VFAAETIDKLNKVVADCTKRDQRLLEDLRADARTLREAAQPIREQQTTSIAMVASDGGNNRVRYDPFLIQLVRVVDSFGLELCMEAVSPTSNTDELSEAQFDTGGEPDSALGRLMRDVAVPNPPVRKLADLAYGSIPPGNADPLSIKDVWVQTYRDLWEWAVLYDRVAYTEFGTHTLLVRDGLLRAKYFRPPYFRNLIDQLQMATVRQAKEHKRNVFLVGVAKHSQVIDRYRLAMTIEDVFPDGSPWYVAVPPSMEAKAYAWPEWTNNPDFTGGVLYLVRFGPRTGDPIWAIDLMRGSESRAPEIFGCLMADARDGFPMPFYPSCLQRAHEYAEVVDWDLEIFQAALISSVRSLVPAGRKDAVDAQRLMSDTSGRRYQ